MKDFWFFSFSLDKGLSSGSRSGVHHMCPVPHLMFGQLSPALDQQHTRVADISTPVLVQSEARREIILVLLTAREPGAGKERRLCPVAPCLTRPPARLGPADTAAIPRAEHFWLVETRHPQTEPRLEISKVRLCLKKNFAARKANC